MRNGNIVIFTKNRIYLRLPGHSKFKKCTYYSEYTLQNLNEKIKNLKVEFKVNNFGVLFNNEISYIFALHVGSDKLGEENIKKEIAQKIPEKIPVLDENLVWDYKIIDGSGHDNIQVAAIDKNVIRALVSSFEGNDVRIDFIEPFCYSLSKLNSKGACKKYVVIFMSEYESTASFVNDGAIVFAGNIDKDSAENTINSFIDFFSAKNELDSKTGLYVYDTNRVIPDTKLQRFYDFGLIKGDVDFDKIVFASPEDLKRKKDSEAINLYLGTRFLHKLLFDEEKVDEKPNDGKSKNIFKKYRPVILVLILVLILICGGFFVFNYLKKSGIDILPKSEVSNIIEEPKIQEAVIEDIPVEEAIAVEVEPASLTNFNGYKVEILNGSGTVGEANKVKALIEPLGFDEIETGNADRYNYKETIISFKDNRLYSGIEILDKALNNYAILVSEANLEDDYPYDMKIIVGSDRLE